MDLNADLHVHSPFSLATSPEMVPSVTAPFAKLKGIDLLGSGDILHPLWRERLRRELVQVEEGLFAPPGRECLFLLTGEVSLIFGPIGKKRKVHLLLLSPSFQEAEELARALAPFGKLESNGRPIFKISLRAFLEILQAVTDRTLFIPAHIWTPHYSLLGALSGFDSLETAFEGDPGPRLLGFETGLSADPTMCVGPLFLREHPLFSSSDAHSPWSLGRETTLLSPRTLSFGGIVEALSRGTGIKETRELPPGLGKYYLQGHRACSVSSPPSPRGTLCPRCGRPFTPGVLARTVELSPPPPWPAPPPFRYCVPLPEILALSQGRPTSSARVRREWHQRVSSLGSESRILFDLSPEELLKGGLDRVSVSLISSLRRSRFRVEEGYDGRYGRLLALEQPGEEE